MNTSQAVEGLDRCIRVRYPAIVILSPEEKRVWGANRALWLVRPKGDEEPLLPLPDGSFRLGEEPSPERVRFEQFIQGKALSAILSGTPYYRFFTP